MTTLQTMLYKVILIDFEFGWVYSDILFESSIYENPTDAMVEFDFAEPTHPNSFPPRRMMKDGEIIEEELFDTSFIEYPF